MRCRLWAVFRQDVQLPGCSTDVYVNSRNPAHVELSLGRCEKHPAPMQVAEGSSNVFINSVAAARKDDGLTCGARISGGSDDVFIGGGTVQYLHIDDEIPGWLRVVVDVLMIVASMGKALVSFAKLGLTQGLKAAGPCALRHRCRQPPREHLRYWPGSRGSLGGLSGSRGPHNRPQTIAGFRRNRFRAARPDAD